MSAGVLDVRVQRRRRRRRVRRHPDQLHVVEFRFASDGTGARCATVLVRGHMGQDAAVRTAHEQARGRGPGAVCVGIQTLSPPRPMPALDALVRRCTAFPDMLALLTAAAGYLPSIRLDLLRRDGLLLARAYDRQQARWGDPRRACVSGQVPRQQRAQPSSLGGA